MDKGCSGDPSVYHRDCEIKDDPFPDDVLTDILVRQPQESLFSLKCVSKRWRRIISSPFFRHLYQSQRTAQGDSLPPLLGFFQSGAEDTFMPTNSMAHNYYTTIANNGISVFGTSRGLLIFYNHHTMAYHVTNPVTKQRLSLPESLFNHYNAAVGFDVEESFDGTSRLEQVKFKVVCLLLSSLTESVDALQMETFSSDTGCWSDSMLYTNMGSILLRPRENALVIDGIFYWLGCMNRVLAYDSKSNPGEGEGEGVTQVLDLPQQHLSVHERSSILGKSKDGLLQYGRSDCFKIVIWVRSCYHEQLWILRHTISFMFLCYHYPDIMSSCDLIRSPEDLRNERTANVPELATFHTLNPNTVFFSLDNKIVRCCLGDGTLKLVQLPVDKCMTGGMEGANPLVGRKNRLFPYYSPKWASFYL